MSDDKDRHAGPAADAPRPGTKTVVGVPSLPADRPSDLEMTRELPPKGPAPMAQPSSTLVGGSKPDPDGSEPNTALDVKAMSSAEAERVLAWTGFTQEEIPTAQGGPASSAAPRPGVAGALPKAHAGAPIKTPPLGNEMLKGMRAGGSTSAMAAERGTRPGVAPQPALQPKGRSTLLLDSSAPPSHLRDGDTGERPPIKVPSSSATPPKAVTQPPPWGEGAVRMSPGIPKGAPPPRAPEPSVEEISASLLLPADSTGEVSKVEELSGSLLIEDAPGGNGLVVKPVPPTSGKAPSMPPPIPGKTSSAPPSGKPSSMPPRSKGGSSFPPPLPKAATPAPGAAHGPAHAHAHASAPVPPPPHAPVPAPVPPHAPAPVPAPGKRTPLGMGMPELPKATPGPSLDFLSAPPADIPVPEPVPDPVFASAAWPPPNVDAPPATASGSAPPMGPASPGPSQPAPPPAAMSGDIELTQLPRGGLGPALDKVRAQLRRVGPVLRAGAQKVGPTLRKVQPALRKLEPATRKAVSAVRGLLAKLPATSALRSGQRPRWFLPVVAAAGLVVGIGLVGLIVSLARGHGASATATAASASAQPPALASAAPAPAPTPSTPPALAACTVSGAPHVVAPSAMLAPGIEVVPLKGDVALGFAPTEHEAMAVRLDTTSLSATATAKQRSAEPVRRVTPILNAKGALSLVADADRKSDRVQGRRTVLTAPPVQVGASDGAVVSARMGGSSAGSLWPLDPGGDVEQLRGAVDPAGDGAVAIAFRRGGAVWMGTAAGSPLAARGGLSHVDGLGTMLGSPAVAMSNGVALVAWSDRPSSDDPWHLRWVRFAAGEAPGAAHDFTPPAGGKGSQTMSPGLAALPGGRFLLVWTEGPAEGHDVRALTLGPDGQAIGAPLVISNPGINAGQGQAAVTASGQGVVAFLESAGSGFQVVATPIACAP